MNHQEQKLVKKPVTQSNSRMKKLTPKEEQVMQILWQLKNAFLKEIWEGIDEPRPPITTIASIVKKLEGEGFIAHESFGRTHRYFAKTTKETYRNSSLKSLFHNYFEGSPKQMLSYFVKEENMDAEEINRLLKEIEEKE